MKKILSKTGALMLSTADVITFTEIVLERMHFYFLTLFQDSNRAAALQ